MVSILEKKIHARSTQPLEEPVHVPRIDGGLDDRERTREQELALRVRSEKTNSPHRGCVGAVASMVEPGKVVGFRWPVDAHGHAGTRLGKEIEQLLAEKGSVGLDTDGVATRRQLSPQAMQKCGELVEAQQQRFPSMENDCEACVLPSSLVDQSIAEGLRDLAMHALWLKAPSGIGPLIHVAVRAVDVAPARGLDENRVEPTHGRHATIGIGRAIDPDCVGCGRGHRRPRHAFRSAPPPSDGRGRDAWRHQRMRPRGTEGGSRRQATWRKIAERGSPCSCLQGSLRGVGAYDDDATKR